MDREEKIALAGEAALGLLEGERAHRAERLAREDPEFRRELTSWKETFAGALDIAPVSPPERIRRRLRARILLASVLSWRPDGPAVLPQNPEAAILLVAKIGLLALVVLILLG